MATCVLRSPYSRGTPRARSVARESAAMISAVRTRPRSGGVASGILGPYAGDSDRYQVRGTDLASIRGGDGARLGNRRSHC